MEKDLNNSDKIKQSDFSDIIIPIFDLTKHQAADLCGKFDKKKTGYVKYKKFLYIVNGEILKESLGYFLDSLRHHDEDIHGVVSPEIFLNVLHSIGIYAENPSIFAGIETDENGNIEYLRFITEFRRNNR